MTFCRKIKKFNTIAPFHIYYSRCLGVKRKRKKYKNRIKNLNEHKLRREYYEYKNKKTHI